MSGKEKPKIRIHRENIKHLFDVYRTLYSIMIE